MPPSVTQCLSSFLDFCYLVRRTEIGESDLVAIETALKTFHAARDFFRTSGVRKGFNLPRQHSMVHYVHLIQEFGAPNGICSSITESRHITAVKRPWRRSNHYEPLGQILLTNQRLDKLAAARVNFIARGMLPEEQITTPSTGIIDEDGAVDGDISSEVSLAIHPRKSSPPFKCTMEEPDIWSQSLDAQRISLRLPNTSKRLTCRCSCDNSSLTSSTLTNPLQCSSPWQTFQTSNQIYQFFIWHMQFSMHQVTFQDHRACTARSSGPHPLGVERKHVTTVSLL